MLPTIRSYLKLYTTISIGKLAALAEADEPTFREHLQCLKHKSHQVQVNKDWTGSGLRTLLVVRATAGMRKAVPTEQLVHVALHPDPLVAVGITHSEDDPASAVLW